VTVFMNTKKKILIIENSVHITGALKSILRLVNDLKYVYSFVFIIPEQSHARIEISKYSFIKVYELPLKEINRKPWSLVRYLPYLLLNAFRVRRIVKTESINLIHSNDLYNLVPAMYKLLGGRLNYICHVRFLPDSFPRFIFNFWVTINLRFGAKIIAVSRLLQSKLPQHYKVSWIPNELPPPEQHPVKIIDTSQKNPVFLYLSNYIPGKGQDLALDSFLLIHQQIPQWKLRFAGGDMGLEKNRAFKQQLMDKVRKLGMESKIEFVNFIVDTELEYKNADIILNFSETESFSITCLEALFYGIPLIASDSGGPREIIDDKQFGFLVANKDINAMASAMLMLAKDPALQRQFAARGRIVCRQRFSRKNTSDQLAKVFDEFLE
jgi:L-malate glycosyltransferase